MADTEKDSTNTNSNEPQYLKTIIPFFEEGTDFSKIKKPVDILDFPIECLKACPDQYSEFFEQFDLHSITDLAQYQEKLEIEGIDPDELTKIALISEMIFWKIKDIAEKGAQKKKILIFGLDNAGKTSALTTLSEKYSSIKELMPTRGLARQSIELFGYDVISYDMGGQKQYREQYFDKADMYFGSGGDVVIFCIDVQDTERYDMAVNYLKQILSTYENFELTPPVLVVFTKMDPDLASNEELNINKMDLISKIEAQTPNFDIGFANSSIYERNSIERLFSRALKRISTSSLVIEKLLEAFTLDINADACALVSTSGLVYASFGINVEREEMLNNSAAYIQNLHLFHLSQGLRREEFYQLEYKNNNLHFIAEFIKEISSDGLVYLWILTSDLRSETLAIGRFKEEILPLIDIFI